jgi:hypothetical protein
MTGKNALVPAEETKMVHEATIPAAKPGLLIATNPRS